MIFHQNNYLFIWNLITSSNKKKRARFGGLFHHALSIVVVQVCVGSGKYGPQYSYLKTLTGKLSQWNHMYIKHKKTLIYIECSTIHVEIELYHINARCYFSLFMHSLSILHMV